MLNWKLNEHKNGKQIRLGKVVDTMMKSYSITSSFFHKEDPVTQDLTAVIVIKGEKGSHHVHGGKAHVIWCEMVDVDY